MHRVHVKGHHVKGHRVKGHHVKGYTRHIKGHVHHVKGHHRMGYLRPRHLKIGYYRVA